MEHLHHHRGTDEDAEEHEAYLPVEVFLHAVVHEAEVLQALEEHEVDDGRERCAAEDAGLPAQAFGDAETEEQAGQELHDGTEHEGDGDAEEDAQDDFERLRGVHVVAQSEREAVGGHLQQHEGERGTEELKHHRYGSGRRHPEGVEGIEQDDVGDHHGEIDEHHVVETEILRTENAVAGNVHHAVAQHAAEEHAHRGDDHQGAEPGRPRTYRGVEEIDGIVAHADKEVERGEQKEEYDHS